MTTIDAARESRRDWRGRWDRLFVPALAMIVTTLVLLILDEPPLYVDGASYLAIAEHWSNGEWSAAVNGYWSPLLSWLVVPGALVGLPLTIAAAAVSVATAGAAVASLQYTMAVGSVNPEIGRIMAIGACPFVVFAALDNLVPDLLMAALLLVFVADVVQGVDRPAKTGVVGGLAFLAKVYALPFMVAFVVVVAGWRFFVSRRSDDRAQLLVPLVAAAALMLVIAGAWSLVISVDEGHLTYSTAAEYNRTITSPGSPGTPYNWVGLIEPAHPSAFWGWEDPAQLPNRASLTQSGDVSVVQASSSAGRIDRIIDNTTRAVRASALVAGSAIVALMALLVTSGRALRGVVTTGASDLSHRSMALLQLGLAAAIYGGGLLWLIVQPRYLYFAMLLFVAISALAMTEVLYRWPNRRRAIRVAVLLLAVATAARPAVALVRLNERVAETHRLEEFLDTVDVTGRRVASYPAQLNVVGARCLVEECVYLGAPRPGGPDSLATQFRQFDVDVFIVGGSSSITIAPGTPVLAQSEPLGYTIYDVAESAPG